METKVPTGSWRGFGSSGGQSCFHGFSPPGLDLLRYPSAQVHRVSVSLGHRVSLLIWSDIVSVLVVFDDLVIFFHIGVYSLALVWPLLLFIKLRAVEGSYILILH